VKSLLALWLAALLSFGAAACGGTSKSTGSASQASSNAALTSSSSTTPSKARGATDGDDIDDSGAYNSPGETEDDNEVTNYGREANSNDLHTATAFAKLYFAAAVANDGATACSLMLPKLAKAIPGGYGKAPDPIYMRGNTCTEVMTKFFEHRHQLLLKEAAGLEVTGVRRTTRTAFILLAFKGIRERRYMGVEQAGHTWKLEALLDSEYP
jgi:hypothetical protein